MTLSLRDRQIIVWEKQKAETKRTRLFNWDDMNFPGIYAIRNITKNKWYIGQSYNITTRWKSHNYDLRGNYHDVQQLQIDYNSGDELTSLVLERVGELSQKQREDIETSYMHFFIKRGIDIYNSSVPNITAELQAQRKQQIKYKKPAKKLSYEHTVTFPNNYSILDFIPKK